MAFDLDMLKDIAAIYKFVYENPNTHRNIIRKKLLKRKKGKYKSFMTMWQTMPQRSWTRL